MFVRWLPLVVVVFMVVAGPISAQEVTSPWSIEVLDVYAETELKMRVGLSTTTYTALNDFVFYIVEIELTYTNAGDSPVQIDLASDSFWLTNQSGDRAIASGTAGPAGGCVDCVSTFPLEIAVGESITLNIPLVFVVAGDNRQQRFMLEFEDLPPIPVLIGDGSVAPRSTATPRATATPRVEPTAAGTLEPTVIETPFCAEMLAEGEMDAEGVYLCIEGDADDWPSKGQRVVLQPPRDVLSLGCAFNDTGVCIVTGDWQASFEPPAGEPFRLGLFENAQRIPFQDPEHPGMDVAQYGGCNTVSEGSRFDIRELTTDPDTGEVTQFAAVFEQYCEGGPVGLRGMVRWEAGSEE